MKADHVSFKRATGVSLTGLGLQLVIGLVLLTYAIILRDPAAMVGAMLILAGSIVWIALAIVFDQHRRERIEAMEADSLIGASARESSVFGERPDDMRIAAKRLAWMHKFLIPAASVLFALVLTGLGIWTFRVGRLLLANDQFRSVSDFGWTIALSIALAFVGFLFARYTSALSKQPGWEILRAGAAQSAGTALIGLSIGIAQSVDYVGSNIFARYLVIILPVLMFVIAVETIGNLLLGLYRPRRKGEIPRPAFESRILGFVAAPDRIAESIGGALNYQFGFDVTGSWFYQLLSRSLAALVLVGLVVMWALTTVGIVQPNEQGLRIRFGQQLGSTLEAGPYLKYPWPFERIERFDATTVRRVNLGGEQPKVRNSILWTNDHGVAEGFFIVQPSASGIIAPGTQARNANDVSLVSAEVPLLYSITDLAAFEQLTAPEHREDMIRAVARREVFKFLATEGVDGVIGRGRTEASAAIRKHVEARLNELNAGIKVLHVGIEGVHPPKDTAEMFEEVVQSLQKRAGGIENGQREANETLIKVAGSVDMARDIVKAINSAERSRAAGEPAKRSLELELDAEALLSRTQGSAASKLQSAKAARWATHMKARARSEAYAGQLASYQACPEFYTAQVYFESLVEVMRKSRLYIVSDDGERLWTTIDLKESSATGDLFKDEPKKPSAE